jgi:hypothetical protein
VRRKDKDAAVPFPNSRQALVSSIKLIQQVGGGDNPKGLRKLQLDKVISLY